MSEAKHTVGINGLTEAGTSATASVFGLVDGAPTLRTHAEAVGTMADKLDNLTAALSIPMPAEFHCAQLRGQLPLVVEELRKAYVGITGENPWGAA